MKLFKICRTLIFLSIIYYLALIEFVLAFVVIWNIWDIISSLISGIKPFFGKLNKSINVLKKFLINKIQLKKFFKLNLRRRLLRHNDESKFVFEFNIFDKLKEFKILKKLDVRKGSSNAEKIKLLYVKIILILTENNYEIKSSQTPNEIKNGLKYRKSDILFDVYEQVRYNYDIHVSDDILQLCETAATIVKE